MDSKNYSLVRLQAHRGVANEYPENTMPAFEAAVEQGYPLIELDPKYTSDGKFVILHDRSLKRTGRTADGAPVEKAINEITYEEALTYDFGLWFGENFRGTKIPTLGEVLDLAANNPQIALKLDNVWQSFDDEHRAAFKRNRIPRRKECGHHLFKPRNAGAGGKGRSLLRAAL